MAQKGKAHGKGKGNPEGNDGEDGEDESDGSFEVTLDTAADAAEPLEELVLDVPPWSDRSLDGSDDSTLALPSDVAWSDRS